MMKRFAAAAIAAVLLAPLASAQVVTGGGTNAPSFSASKYVNAGTSAASETNLASVAIPANSLGPNGYIEITALYTLTNNANSKSPAVRLAATQGAVTGGVAFSNAFPSNASVQIFVVIRNQNATNSQVTFNGSNSFAGASNALNTGSVDTTQDTWVSFNCSVAVGTDVCTLLGWNVKVYSQSIQGAVMAAGSYWYASVYPNVALTGSTSETVLADVPIPANLLGPTGVLRITTSWSMTNNANTKTPRIHWSATANSTAGTQISGPGIASAGAAQTQAFVRNTGSTGAQTVTAPFQNNQYQTLATAPTAFAVDTTQPTHLTITGQLGVSTDTMTLLGVTAEALHP